MNKAFYTAVIFLLLIVSSKAYSQSNKGTEFWAVYMAHNAGATASINSSRMVLYITSDISTTGSVDIGGVLLQNFTVIANQVTFITIPPSAYLDKSGYFRKSGVHITSVNPIAVYAHIYANSVSGATLLLPVNAMGKEYLSLNYKQVSNARPENPAYSVFDILATEDNTTVTINPTADLLTGDPARTAFTITLNKGEVYQGLSATDLTGTKIQSISNNGETCKKIAVFSGSSRIGIGVQDLSGPFALDFSSDNLFQQVYPTSAWGKHYVTAPLKSRPFDVYRIVLSSPNTTVTLNGLPLNPNAFADNLYYEFKSSVANVIAADKPIQVVQYSPTQGQLIDGTQVANGDVGDPEMIYLNPVEQGLSRMTLYSTAYYKILQSYVNVVIPTNAVSSFKLDGVSYSNAFIPIQNSPYSYAQIAVTSGPQADQGLTGITTGTHTLNASVPFNAVAYGFGPHESYGYSGGTNLQDANEFVGLKDPQDPTLTSTIGCTNQTYQMAVTLPYQTNSIVWKIDNVVTNTTSNPVANPPKVKDGVVLYTYDYPSLLNLPAGTHSVIATVFNPVADLCGSYKDVENELVISSPAVVKFDVAPSNCLGDPTNFTFKPDPNAAGAVKSWLWDFGDNTTSTEQNPKHIYATSNPAYQVRLTITDYAGCNSVSDPVAVTVIPKPIAAFTYAPLDCAGQAVAFNSSTSKGGTAAINAWAWDFGDAASGALNVSTEANPTHIYTSPGKYSVKLSVTSACSSDPVLVDVIVNPLPDVDFKMPDICVGDANSQFTSTSKIADNTETEFTYLWDFGDPASGGNNTSTLQNPKHSYLGNGPGPYNVKLTVTSKYGCSNFKIQQLKVNGADPKAVFSPLSPQSFCSGDSVAFVDQSLNPSFGNITKIVWYWDYDSNPADKQEFDKDHMRSDRTYRHFYNGSASVTSHTVVLMAYSGESCFNPSAPQIIKINPNPVATLKLGGAAITAPVVMCQNDNAITITPTANMSGTSVFTGAGITANGTFDPGTVKPGIYTVNYLFTADGTGCTYATSFTLQVNAAPLTSLPAEYIVLEGAQVTLRPQASVTGGAVLTYKWVPSTGLSQDNVANPVVTLSTDTKYTLTITSTNGTGTGCTTIAQTEVKVLRGIVVPNAFTPNGDGVNDTWEIKYLDQYPNATVEVFNRYGSKVFLSNRYSKAWDGRFNGSDLPMGTYYYIINPNSGRKPITGNLTIIR